MEHNELTAVIGQNVRKYRNNKGITQAQLAEHAGVGTTFISKVERGQKMMKVQTLYLIAQKLEVSCDTLLTPEGDGLNETEVQNIVALLSGRPQNLVQSVERIVRTLVKELEMNLF